MSVINTILSASKIVKNERDIGSVHRKLVEEVGELATEIDIELGKSYKAPSEDGIIGEAVDSILAAVDVIYLHNPDITEKELLSIVKRKCDKWSISVDNHYLSKSDESSIKSIAQLAYNKSTNTSYFIHEFNSNEKTWMEICMFLAGRNPFNIIMTSDDIVNFLQTKHMKWMDCDDYISFMNYFKKGIIDNFCGMKDYLISSRVIPTQFDVTEDSDGFLISSNNNYHGDSNV